MVKALSPEVLHEVVHGCLQLHGGTGFMRGTTIETHGARRTGAHHRGRSYRGDARGSRQAM